ncbi:MAG: protein translocase subunit SecF [Desulfobacterales bacterium]|nr:protein translocase subunit SecF [Desulfobacterales bacterium]
MQFIKSDINLDFIGKRKIAFCLSAIMILISIGSLVLRNGPKYGIDFAGGSLVQVQFSDQVDLDAVKAGLSEMALGNPSVQSFGEAEDHEYLIRTDGAAAADENFANNIESALTASTGKKAEMRRLEMVGPQVGKDLREKALLAMFYALLFITIYISGRFELKWMLSGVMAGALMAAVYFLNLFQVSIPFLMTGALVITLILFRLLGLRYAMGAITALIHDITITVGLFSIFDKEFTLPIIAALLTIIGYSLNDTIIVFDRIRENLRKLHKNPMDFIVNKSINETLSRTILTSLTTLIVLVCLFVLGGGIIHDFAFALIVGVLVGTYSSVFVASPILLAFHESDK